MREKKSLFAGLCLLSVFALWTAAVCLADVREIGPEGSKVGLAAINGYVHALTGVSMPLYRFTDWLGLVPIVVAALFALLGLRQWIARRSLVKVDRSLLVLGGFYLAVMAAYIFFETVIINYRPVLIDGVLEVSYPSSTTLLVLCVMPTAAMQVRERIQSQKRRRCLVGAIAVYAVFTVLARFLSGVHWCSDIVGGVLLSAALVLLYRAFCGAMDA